MCRGFNSNQSGTLQCSSFPLKLKCLSFNLNYGTSNQFELSYICIICTFFLTLENQFKISLTCSVKQFKVYPQISYFVENYDCKNLVCKSIPYSLVKQKKSKTEKPPLPVHQVLRFPLTYTVSIFTQEPHRQQVGRRKDEPLEQQRWQRTSKTVTQLNHIFRGEWRLHEQTDSESLRSLRASQKYEQTREASSYRTRNTQRTCNESSVKNADWGQTLGFKMKIAPKKSNHLIWTKCNEIHLTMWWQNVTFYSRQTQWMMFPSQGLAITSGKCTFQYHCTIPLSVSAQATLPQDKEHPHQSSLEPQLP